MRSLWDRKNTIIFFRLSDTDSFDASGSLRLDAFVLDAFFESLHGTVLPASCIHAAVQA